MAEDQLLPVGVDGERLTIRHWRPDDVPALGDAITASREHLRPWMAWVVDEPLSDADRLTVIESWQRTWAAGGDSVYGAFVDDMVVGSCGLHRRAGSAVLEIGYWVHVDHLRRGYAHEIASTLTTAAFTVPGVERVEIHHDEANLRSRAVPVRLGFSLVGSRPDEPVAPGEIGVDVAWSITRHEWGLGPQRAAAPD
jgi:RimJ/RimL family protein N-acetyltransferase